MPHYSDTELIETARQLFPDSQNDVVAIGLYRDYVISDLKTACHERDTETDHVIQIGWQQYVDITTAKFHALVELSNKLFNQYVDKTYQVTVIRKYTNE